MSKRKQGSRDAYDGPRVLRGTVAVGISPMRSVLRWVQYKRLMRQLCSEGAQCYGVPARTKEELDESFVDHDTQQRDEEEE